MKRRQFLSVTGATTALAGCAQSIGIQANASAAELVRSRLIWLDTHIRTSVKNMRPDECPDQIARFHRQMPGVLQQHCGPTRVASVFDATLALMQDDSTGWHTMTGDGVHWTRPIPLLSARALLLTMLN